MRAIWTFLLYALDAVFSLYFTGREQVSRGHGERRIYPSRECPRLCQGDFPKSKNKKGRPEKFPSPRNIMLICIYSVASVIW